MAVSHHARYGLVRWMFHCAAWADSFRHLWTRWRYASHRILAGTLFHSIDVRATHSRYDIRSILINCIRIFSNISSCYGTMHMKDIYLFSGKIYFLIRISRNKQWIKEKNQFSFLFTIYRKIFHFSFVNNISIPLLLLLFALYCI